jgi:hypothetical protein
MDDSAFRRFFAHPTQLYHRQYEALRAVFYEGRSQKQVAGTFGFQYDSLRQLVRQFHGSLAAECPPTESPFLDRSKGIARRITPCRLFQRLRIGRR